MRLLFVLLFCFCSLQAMQRSTETTYYDDGSTTTVYQTDEWVGPGIYYGFWFWNENDYWNWRYSRGPYYGYGYYGDGYYWHGNHGHYHGGGGGGHHGGGGHGGGGHHGGGGGHHH